jgi:hypothetical protein
MRVPSRGLRRGDGDRVGAHRRAPLGFRLGAGALSVERAVLGAGQVSAGGMPPPAFLGWLRVAWAVPSRPALRHPAGGPQTTRSTFCWHKQQKDERIASALGSSGY